MITSNNSSMLNYFKIEELDERLEMTASDMDSGPEGGVSVDTGGTIKVFVKWNM